ncbi:MAG: hypothetical protein R3E01_07085 [Pirellulaceae bacterium]|nr:hypothetical protein [Planctomycetales bacterium]
MERTIARDVFGSIMVAVVVVVGAPTAQGQDAGQSRYYNQDGVTFRETTTTVKEPVSETKWQSQQQTTYRERYITEMQPVQRQVYAPVTQYEWVPRWHGWWRVFQGPHLAYHLEPRTSWQAASMTYQLPVTKREVVPETRTVQVPVTTLRMVEREQVQRTAVAASPQTRVAYNAPMVDPYATVPAYGYLSVGGIARYESDPPRYSTAALPDDSGWRPRR